MKKRGFKNVDNNGRQYFDGIEREGIFLRRLKLITDRELTVKSVRIEAKERIEGLVQSNFNTFFVENVTITAMICSIVAVVVRINEPCVHIGLYGRSRRAVLAFKCTRCTS